VSEVFLWASRVPSGKDLILGHGHFILLIPSLLFTNDRFIQSDYPMRFDSSYKRMYNRTESAAVLCIETGAKCVTSFVVVFFSV
jgi:hypothetical protein